MIGGAPLRVSERLLLLLLRKNLSSKAAYRLQPDELELLQEIRESLGVDAFFHYLGVAKQQRKDLKVLPRETRIAFNAIICLGLVGTGTNNARVAQMLRDLFVYYPTNDIMLFAIRYSLGLVYAGKGTVRINVTHSRGRVVSPSRLACIMALALFLAPASRAVLHREGTFLLYLVAGALRPRTVHCIDSAGHPVATSVRVGTFVDTVGLAGQAPSRLTGFQTHDTPVVATVGGSGGEGVEFATDRYISPTAILEDITVVKTNDWAEAEAALD
ncbi:26S proteasome regulatory complex, non-ATPase subcomplex, Rpn1 subunit [Kipferlia bialata]|uniref:26S proteasome regulatory complex, non-ATPase subcomplex, Rpn1 subunit n=1 Tax=Kipferlia bialata TaxID=797122 RepID=A0A9K3CXK9_9EUKA|nr:26S proteasome regulatory complex, non-ATPase subcomplex, Rpn1 subunit [Kipferlia bialata]|eukprot:g4865.t1